MKNYVAYSYACPKCKETKAVEFKDGGPAQISMWCPGCGDWSIASLPGFVDGSEAYHARAVARLDAVARPDVTYYPEPPE